MSLLAQAFGWAFQADPMITLCARGCSWLTSATAARRSVEPRASLAAAWPGLHGRPTAMSWSSPCSDRARGVSVPGMKLQPFPRASAHWTWIFPSILMNGGWLECPCHRRIVAQCNTYGPDGALVEERAFP